MSYFKDLTEYQYYGYNPKLFNIGWLDNSSNDYPKGETSQEFKDKLKKYLDYPQNKMRGYYNCPFCINVFSNKETMSDCEIWIVGKDNKVYSSPQLIVHYIEKHNYLPPTEFIDAVLNGPLPNSKEYNDIISDVKKSYSNPDWYIKQRKKESKQNYKKCIDGMAQELANNINKDILNNIINLKT